MNRFLPFFTLLLLGATLSAQTVIIDHEAPATTTTFQYFGSTIDGTVNEVIANPNATGVNASAMVGKFDKPANSEVWAGAFSNPDPAVPVSLIGATEVCVDVHMDHIGNLALKLENSTTGGGNWVRPVANTVVNDWEKLCFDVSLLSVEDPMVAAAGNSYSRVVLFFDFQMNFDTANVYYFDNIVTDGVAGSTVSITFNVGTSDIVVSPEGLFIAGGGNFGEPGDNQLTDPDGDGIYSITVTKSAGFSSFYTFANGACADFSCKEQLAGLACANPDNFNDRFFPGVTQDTVINTCYEKCDGTAMDCGDGGGGEEVSITFNLGTSNITVSEDGVFIAGGARFGAPGDNPLLDVDEDGVYSLTITRPKGFSSHYTFTNGACANFSCKEDIGGQACADAGNFNDRFLPRVMNDTIINTCFGQCTDDTMCPDPLQGGNITFSVNMSDYEPAFDTVFVAGPFTQWEMNPVAMSDEDGDKIWTVTLPIEGGITRFKFQLDRGTVWEGFDGVAGDCNVQNGEFIDRALTVDGDAVLETTCFNTCTVCAVSTRDLDAYGISFSLRPTLASDRVYIDLTQGNSLTSELQLISADGRLLRTLRLTGESRQSLDVSGLASGAYFVRLQHENAVGVRRFVKQ